MSARLITIRFSHFCEKGRWALDRVGFPYTEDYHAPGFHVRPVRKAGAKRTTPVLVLPDRVIPDSTDILHFADTLGAGLFPTEPALRQEVEALESLFDDKLGPSVRRLAYFDLFQVPSRLVVELFRSAAQPSEAGWVGPMFPLLRFLMKRGLKIDKDGAARSQKAFDAVMAQIEPRLADGRKYLAGDRFTAADLAFAALYAPFVAPPEYGAPLPGFNEMPEPFASRARAAAQRPAGQFALRMYREHRRERVAAALTPAT